MNDGLLTGSGWLRVVLSLFGMVAVTWAITAGVLRHEFAVWVLVAIVIADLAWVALIVQIRPRLAIEWPLAIIMVIAGGLAAAAGDGSPILPAAVGVVLITRDIRIHVRGGIALGIGGILVVLVGDAIAPVTPLGLAAMEIGLAVAFLAGQSRRQFILTDIRTRELAEEQSRTDVLAARQQIAHDIHDVLAHSLGGLVIQLDAVDALLEAGDVAAAEAKVKDARTLAKTGMSEARRAVAALSEPPADAVVSGDRMVEELHALLEVHRSLGGEVTFAETGSRRDVPEALGVAVRRAVQEGLTNARKHAPGEPVVIDLDWHENTLGLEVSNAASSTPRATGGGHGLVGMRARFDALPGGSATARTRDGHFVVHAEASIA